MRCDARGKACVYFRIGCECEQPNRSLDRIHIICCPVGKKNLSISSCEKCEVLVRRGNRIFNITLLGEHISRRCSLMPRIPESGHVDGWIGYFLGSGSEFRVTRYLQPQPGHGRVRTMRLSVTASTTVAVFALATRKE
jgi:uncharacterized protein YbaR (Trm112 family)